MNNPRNRTSSSGGSNLSIKSEEDMEVNEELSQDDPSKSVENNSNPDNPHETKQDELDINSEQNL